MSINEISIRTALAAVRKDSSIRVYMTAVDGGVREVQYDETWTGGTSGNVIANGKIGTPVAATNQGFDRIRVYYITPENTLGESCWDNQGWYTGDLQTKNKFAVAPYSGVSAVFIGKVKKGPVPVVRVYAQLADNTLQEFCCKFPFSIYTTCSAGFLPTYLPTYLPTRSLSQVVC